METIILAIFNNIECYYYSSNKMENFLKNCCRVCLSIENEMIDSSNIVENFDKTIDQLLFDCANLKVDTCIVCGHMIFKVYFISM